MFSQTPENEEKDEKEEKKEDEIQPLCICGTIMKEYKANEIYGGGGVWCDGCRLKIDPTENMYHCPAEKTVSHSGMKIHLFFGVITAIYI